VRKRVYEGSQTSLSGDLKEAAELELDKLEEKWGKKYPIVINSWRNK